MSNKVTCKLLEIIFEKFYATSNLKNGDINKDGILYIKCFQAMNLEHKYFQIKLLFCFSKAA